MASLHFVGAAQSTTGSKHLLSWHDERHTRRLLVDCGMFQGPKALRELNWADFPVKPELIDAVVLTHGHLDHCGWLPRLVRAGFDGPIYATAATLALAELILRDSAHIQEEDARHAKKFGYSKHKNPQPLYTEQDVEKTLPLMQPLEYFRSYELLDGLRLRLHHSGHILGSAFVEATLRENDQTIRVVFSGDVGRFDQPILQDPEPPTGADYFLLEGTYGDRLHSTIDPLDEIADVVNRTVERGGSVVIPSFAVGRSQQLLYYLAELLDAERIAPIDIFLDSPMAVRVTRSLREHPEELDLQTLLGVREERIFTRPEVHLIEQRAESMKLNERDEPCVIISASGMATAGRILHHMKRRIKDEKNTILLVGYQGEGTRGRRLLEGEKEIKIHGQMHPVRAEVVAMSSLSAHADYSEMLPWLRQMVPPALTFLVHGEPEALGSWGERLRGELGWHIAIPERGEIVELAPIDPSSRTLASSGAAQLGTTAATVLVLGQGQSPPSGILSEESFEAGELDEALAARILEQTQARDILLVGSVELHGAAQKALRAAGRRLWRLGPLA